MTDTHAESQTETMKSKHQTNDVVFEMEHTMPHDKQVLLQSAQKSMLQKQP